MSNKTRDAYGKKVHKKFTDDGLSYYLAKGEPVTERHINMGEGVGRALDILRDRRHEVQRGEHPDGTVYWRIDGEVLMAHEITKKAGMWK
jgi:hypothetical protein